MSVSARSAQRVLAPAVLGILLVVVLVTMTAMSPYFLVGSNLLSALDLAAPLGIIAVGMTFVILLGGIDLSVGSTLALSAVCLGLASGAGWPTWLSALVPLVVGALAGVANGFLVSRFALPAIVVTIATMAVYGGLALAVSGGRSLPVDQALGFVGLGKIGAVPTAAVLWVVVAALGVGVLTSTPFGEYVYALGTSAGAAEHAALRVRQITLAVYGLSGLLSGLAALVAASQASSAKSNFGTGFELSAVTIVVVGGAALTGGRGTLWGTALATVFVAFLNNGMSISFIPAEVQTMFVGLALIVTAVIYRWVPPLLGRLPNRGSPAPQAGPPVDAAGGPSTTGAPPASSGTAAPTEVHPISTTRRTPR